MEDSRKTDFEKHKFFEIYFPTIPHPTSACSLRREVAKTDGSQKENSVSLVMYKKTTRNKKNRVKNFEHHSDAQNINSVLFVTCSFLTSKSILISVILARYKKAAYKKKKTKSNILKITLKLKTSTLFPLLLAAPSHHKNYGFLFFASSVVIFECF